MFHFESELEKTIISEVQMYTEKEYTPQLITAMLSKDASTHTSIAVDSMSLFESNIAFAHYMFQKPKRALRLLEDAFRKVCLDITKTHVLKADMVYKENLHVRLIALPNLPEVYRSNLPNCSDVGQFLCISGTVVRASTAKMLQYKKLWRCTKCKYQFIVEAEVEQAYICKKPLVCNNPEFCNGKNFTMMSSDINTEWCKDYQEIKLQEQVYNLNVGTVPRSMWVVLEDDLVETCHPGNDVIVSGVLIQQWKPLFKDNPISIELVILAHNIEVQNKMSSGVVSKDMAHEFRQFWQSYKADPLSGRNFILSSICPQVFGLYIVKLAVALVLAGGVRKKSGSSRIRGDSHLLLIGDPGTAKSQFLKFTTKVSTRSVLTSGIGTTNAGLTVSAVKESGRWELEAGALVLADGGICCIDEFSCIKEQDKTCIHEAMEQQTISVAKAGLVCSLNTRCSILAATNPKGKYDENMSISENTALGTPLLSRFDIILVLLDTYDEKWDNMVASYILEGRNIAMENKDALWSVAKMKNYFTLIRHINPRVTPDAERVLRSYYTKQRSLQSRNASRTTPRLLQSLIRLAEGHARLMFRTEVLITDAVISIILMESSMLDNSILEGLKPLHTVFPNDPLTEYIENAKKVFQNLNIKMAVEENYECFYEETNLKNLLSDISTVWNSKDNPYIFGSQSCDISSLTEHHQESDIGTSEITSMEYDIEMSEGTEDMFHKIPQDSSYSTQNSMPVQQNVVAEVHKNNNFSSLQTVSKELNNAVSTLSDLRTMFGGATEISDSKNTENSFVLHRILEEPSYDGSNDSVNLNSKISRISYAKTICNNEATTSNARKLSSNSNETSVKSDKISHFERSATDILEELGISPEKEHINSQINPPSTSSEYSSSLLDKSVTINKIFPPKRSLADQLKNFAFSKSHLNSQHNFINNKVTSNSNENNTQQETSSLSRPENSKRLKLDFCNRNDKTNLSTNKKSAFKMIVDKCRSSQTNNILEKSNDDASPSKFLQNKQDCGPINNCNNNQMSHETIKCINETPKIKEDLNHFATDDHTTQNSLTVEQVCPVREKKPVSDKLKTFVFSKYKKSKSQSSVNSTND